MRPAEASDIPNDPSDAVPKSVDQLVATSGGSVHRLTDRARRTAGLIAAILTLAACVPSGRLANEHAPSPTFDPLAFFAGRTAGRGSLKIPTKHRQVVLVEGLGTISADGGIVLDQEVRRGDGLPTHRTWHLHRVGTDRYAGSLSDAVGPVAGEVSGNRLHLSFAMRGGYRVQQWLYLQAGGQVARNRMVVTKFGLPVASLDEVITRRPV